MLLSEQNCVPRYRSSSPPAPRYTMQGESLMAAGCELITRAARHSYERMAARTVVYCGFRAFAQVLGNRCPLTRSAGAGDQPLSPLPVNRERVPSFPVNVLQGFLSGRPSIRTQPEIALATRHGVVTADPSERGAIDGVQTGVLISVRVRSSRQALQSPMRQGVERTVPSGSTDGAAERF